MLRTLAQTQSRRDNSIFSVTYHKEERAEPDCVSSDDSHVMKPEKQPHDDSPKTPMRKRRTTGRRESFPQMLAAPFTGNVTMVMKNDPPQQPKPKQTTNQTRRASLPKVLTPWASSNAPPTPTSFTSYWKEMKQRQDKLGSHNAKSRIAALPLTCSSTDSGYDASVETSGDASVEMRCDSSVEMSGDVPAMPKQQGAATAMTKQEKKSSVSFGTIEIMEHSVRMGDCPSCNGAPLALGNDIIERRTLDLEQYEGTRPERRSRKKLIIPSSRRTNILLRLGYELEDIADIIIANSELQEVRKASLRQRKLTPKISEATKSGWKFWLRGATATSHSHDDSTDNDHVEKYIPYAHKPPTSVPCH